MNALLSYLREPVDTTNALRDVPDYTDYRSNALNEALAGTVANEGYNIARAPLTASENLLSAIGSGDRWAPGLAFLDFLANVPGPTESLLAKLGPLTMRGVNALRDIASPAMYVGPKSALWKKGPQVGELAGTKVFHGTDANPFDMFDMSKVRTAQHIYTTPDQEGAQFFGKNILEMNADLGKHADLTDIYNPDTQKTLKKVFKEIGEDYWGKGKQAYQEFLDDISDGQLYQKFASQHPQNSIMNELFGMGYDSVKIPDQMGGGRLGESIVFNNPERLKPPPETYPQGSFSNLYDKRPMLEISDEGAKLDTRRFTRSKSSTREGVIFHSYEGKLGNVLNHPQLFEAYPELKDIEVKVGFDNSDWGRIDHSTGEYTPKAGGEYNPIFDKITVHSGSNKDESLSSLLHEIQHAIQEREGWARGGSPALGLSEEGKKIYEVLAQPLREQLIKATEISEKDAIKQALYELPNKAEMLAYRNLFGEYMARDTSSRSGLNALERMSTMPLSSEAEMIPEKMIYRY